jgi:hypothetical protein
MTTRRRLAGLNLARDHKTERMSPLGGGTVARFIAEMSFDQDQLSYFDRRNLNAFSSRL